MSKVYQLDDEKEESLCLTKQILCEMFKFSNIVLGVSNNNLQKLGGEKGIASYMNINLKDGLSEEQVYQQRQIYGINSLVQKQLEPVWVTVLKNFQNKTISILFITWIISTIISMIENPVSGWAQGYTIIIIRIVIAGIIIFVKIKKEQQFRKLQDIQDKITVKVKRNGQVISIDSTQVVVGDLLLFNKDNFLNVDGILIEESQLKVDQSSFTGEDEFNQFLPFIFSGTKVVEGSGIMLVLVVGESTSKNQVKKSIQTRDPANSLYLKKLESVAQDLKKFGLVAIVIFISLIINYILDYLRYAQRQDLYGTGFQVLETLKYVNESLMIGLMIIYLATPDGLPLVVILKLAFLIKKMKDEQILVRNLESWEMMGRVNNICTDKTGILTQNKLKVVKIFHQNEFLQGLEQGQIAKPISSQLLAEAICINSSPWPQRNPVTGQFDHIGSPSDCALLDLADSWGYDYTKYRPNDNIIVSMPFTSSRKRMITVIQIQDSQTLRVFVKGASELILKDCVSFLQPDSSKSILNQEENLRINNQIIESFGIQGLRTIAIAYKDFDKPFINGQYGGQEELQQWIQQQGDDFLLKGLTLISILGIKDPLRPDVIAAIKECHSSGINVRIVCGDNIVTARDIAKECGILVDSPLDNSERQIMEGQHFRYLVGGLKVIKGPDGQERNVVGDLDKFRTIIDELKVLARATPEDKYILITGLIQLENIVAVTGDGTNDAPAFLKADVGIAMGISGSDIIKEVADIILLDDNFSSIVKGLNIHNIIFFLFFQAFKWGRNFQDCIRKFIQFEFTIIIVVLTMTTIGTIFIGKSPLNTIEIFWVSLITNTLASIAFAYETCSEQQSTTSMEFSNRPRILESILTPQMYRFILFQSIFQITILSYILFIPPKELFIENWQTLNALIILQVFNQIHSRKLYEASLNPFDRASENRIFWAIQIITLIVQFLFIQYDNENFIGVVKLNWKQHVFCLLLGVAELFYGVIVRVVVPIGLFSISFSQKKKELVNQEGMKLDKSQSEQ